MPTKVSSEIDLMLLELRTYFGQKKPVAQNFLKAFSNIGIPVFILRPQTFLSFRYNSCRNGLDSLKRLVT